MGRAALAGEAERGLGWKKRAERDWGEARSSSQPPPPTSSRESSPGTRGWLLSGHSSSEIEEENKFISEALLTEAVAWQFMTVCRLFKFSSRKNVSKRDRKRVNNQLTRR